MTRILNAGVRFYVVQRGDTLSGIAKRLGYRWRELASLNRLRNPHLIQIGQLLELPL